MKVVFVILCLLPTLGFSQLSSEEEAHIEELKQLIERANHDTTVVRAIQDWDDMIYHFDAQLDLQLNLQVDSICAQNLEKSLSQEEEGFFNHARSTALNNLGLIYRDHSNYEKGISYFNKSLVIAKANKDTNRIAALLNNTGIAYYFMSDYDVAVEHFEQSLVYFKQLNDKLEIANIFNNLGSVYNDKGDYVKAIDYYDRSLKIREQIGDKEGIATSLKNLGTIYLDQESLEKSKQNFLKSLELFEEIGDDMNMAGCFNNLGSIHQREEEYDKALLYHRKSLTIKQKIGDRRGIAMSLDNIGVIYKQKGDYKAAEDHYLRSLEIREEIGDKDGQATTLYNLGKIYLIKKDYQEALKFGKKSLKIAQEANSPKRLKLASGLLWKLKKEMGDYREALEMYELYITFSDSINSEMNQKAVIRQEYKYEYEKQAAADSVKNAESLKVQDALLTAEKAENERKESQLKQDEIEKQRQDQRTWFLGGVLALAVLFGLFIFNRFRLTRKQRDIINTQKQKVESQKLIVEEQKAKVDEAYEQLEEKNTEILDSINYARRIQSAILPPDKLVKTYLENSFILYKPKDIVAGDFYWLEPLEDTILFAAADCTGHGVPGAMVSVVCNNGLNRSVREHGLIEPGQILDKTREIVIAEFEKSEEEVKDGMDIALCALNGRTLKYAGAHNPLWIIRSHAAEVEEIKAHKQPIGQYTAPSSYPTHTIELNPGDSFYIFSDGFADQFGGEKGKKFKTANFKRLLLSIQNETMDRQRELIDEAFENWKKAGNHEIEQLDDVCVIGVRV